MTEENKTTDGLGRFKFMDSPSRRGGGGGDDELAGADLRRILTNLPAFSRDIDQQGLFQFARTFLKNANHDIKIEDLLAFYILGAIAAPNKVSDLVMGHKE